MCSKAIKAWLILVCMILPLSAMALTADKDQPVLIEADSLDIDDKAGVSTYRGNVRMSQGSIVVLADVITVYSPERELKKVVCVGLPASFQQRLEGEDSVLRAEAETIKY